MFDPEKTSYWFSLGPRALVECDSIMLLQRVSEVSEIHNINIKYITIGYINDTFIKC